MLGASVIVELVDELAGQLFYFENFEAFTEVLVCCLLQRLNESAVSELVHSKL
jgi:hypothetical protein